MLLREPRCLERDRERPILALKLVKLINCFNREQCKFFLHLTSMQEFQSLCSLPVAISIN